MGQSSKMENYHQQCTGELCVLTAFTPIIEIINESLRQLTSGTKKE
jgi:hypothetical protein